MTINDIAATVRSIAKDDKRAIVAIAGPPAAGKSTFAKDLMHALGEAATIVSMDGFHLDNMVLGPRGLLDRKGAPETFDVNGFACLIERLNNESHIAVPTFDRTRDLAIAGAAIVEPRHRIVLVEGNYLLLDQEPWARLACHWDFSIFLNAPEDVLEARLIQRWLNNDHSPEQARARAMQNDIPNAKVVLAHSKQASMIVQNFNGRLN